MFVFPPKHSPFFFKFFFKSVWANIENWHRTLLYVLISCYLDTSYNSETDIRVHDYQVYWSFLNHRSIQATLTKTLEFCPSLNYIDCNPGMDMGIGSSSVVQKVRRLNCFFLWTKRRKKIFSPGQCHVQRHENIL